MTMASPPTEPGADVLRQRLITPSSTFVVNSDRVAAPKASSSSSSSSSKTPPILHLWDDLPPWRRDNTFILSGYRAPQPSYRHAVRSLFYLHNESVNIWSHLLGAVLAAAASLYLWATVHPRYASASRADTLVFACFFGGAVLCLGMSATFHMLIDHSEAVARWGNKLDYTGIVALIVGSYVPSMYYGFFCRPDLMRRYLALVSVLSYRPVMC